MNNTRMATITAKYDIIGLTQPGFTAVEELFIAINEIGLIVTEFSDQ